MGNRRIRERKQAKKKATTLASASPIAVSAGKSATHYDCGKKRPVGPNPNVVAMRRVLLGKPGAKGHALQPAENALDLAVARGWLDEDLRDAAADFAKLNGLAGVEVSKCKTSTLERIERAYHATEGDPVAHAKLRAIWMRLQPTPHVARTLVDVCLLGEWPAWVNDRVSGRVDAEGKSPPAHEIERDRLIYGLKVVQVVAAVHVSDDTRTMLREALHRQARSCDTRRWLDAVA